LPCRRELEFAVDDAVAVGNLVAVKAQAQRADRRAHVGGKADGVRGQAVCEGAGGERQPRPVHLSGAQPQAIANRLDLQRAEEALVIERSFQPRRKRQRPRPGRALDAVARGVDARRAVPVSQRARLETRGRFEDQEPARRWRDHVDR